VRIDGTYGVGIGPLPEDKGNGSPPKTDRPQGQPGPEAAQTDLYAPQQQYIRSASASDEINRQAVADAKELLRSGKLDTPEAAARTAEAILNLGI
jgi:hypothetical protein